MKNKAAISLAKMGRGVPKVYTPEELTKRTNRLLAGQKTWLAKKKYSPKPQRVKCQTKE